MEKTVVKALNQLNRQEKLFLFDVLEVLFHRIPCVTSWHGSARYGTVRRRTSPFSRWLRCHALRRTAPTHRDAPRRTGSGVKEPLVKLNFANAENVSHAIAQCPCPSGCLSVTANLAYVVLNPTYLRKYSPG